MFYSCFLDQFYAWLTVFVVPINSALNPMIYTITTPSFKHKLSQQLPSHTDLSGILNMSHSLSGAGKLGCTVFAVYNRHSCRYIKKSTLTLTETETITNTKFVNFFDQIC